MAWLISRKQSMAQEYTYAVVSCKQEFWKCDQFSYLNRFAVVTFTLLPSLAFIASLLLNRLSVPLPGMLLSFSISDMLLSVSIPDMLLSVSKHYMLLSVSIPDMLLSVSTPDMLLSVSIPDMLSSDYIPDMLTLSPTLLFSVSIDKIESGKYYRRNKLFSAKLQNKQQPTKSLREQTQNTFSL